MKKTVLVLAAALTLTAGSVAAAQEAARAQEERPTFGFGIAFAPVDLGASVIDTANRVTFCLPVNLGALRIEPELGYFSVHDDGDETTEASLGVGVLYQSRPRHQTSLHVGGRIGYARFSDQNLPGPTTRGIDLRLAAVAGGEYLVSPIFGIGAEGQLRIISRGVEGTGRPATLTQTAGVFFLRYYFL